MSRTALLDPRALLEGASRRLEEPRSLTNLRLEALDAFSCLGAPDRAQHLWRYSDPAAFLPTEDSLARSAEGLPGSLERASRDTTIPEDLASQVRDGRLCGAAVVDLAGGVRVDLAGEAARAGVLVTSLGQAARESTSIVEPHLGRLVGLGPAGGGRGKIEALNLALWSHGILVHVPRKLTGLRPLHILFRAPGGQEEAPGALHATRLLAILEEGAELTLVEEHEGGQAGLHLHSVAELFAGPESGLQHTIVERLAGQVTYHAVQRVAAERDSRVLTALASLGGAVVKCDHGSVLVGPGASSEIVGFVCAEGTQRFDHHTLHDHQAPHTRSDIDFKVVLKDKATSAYTGLIRIDGRAPDSEAYQENRNLILNQGPKAESIPELEILTDEVKCTHGATVGTLDPQHLFYLMCRGLPRQEAIRLIVAGFIEPTLRRFPDGPQERLRSLVERRIENLQ